jgi:GLPGLI family protein
MKTKLTIFVSLFCINTVFCQYKNAVVNYTFKLQTPEGSSATFFKSLHCNEAGSLFLDLDSSKIQSGRTMLAKDNKKLNKGLYIDRAGDFGIYFSPIFGKNFYVKEDSLFSQIQWNLNDTLQKKILDFNCKAATAYFRGRQYIAYYTEELPFSSGPWKFVGLPGLILEVFTTDRKFAYEAYKFTGQPTAQALANPYLNADIKFLSFVEHKKLYLKKLADMQNKIVSEEKDKDVQLNIKDNSMELLK